MSIGDTPIGYGQPARETVFKLFKLHPFECPNCKHTLLVDVISQPDADGVQTVRRVVDGPRVWIADEEHAATIFAIDNDGDPT